VAENVAPLVRIAAPAEGTQFRVGANVDENLVLQSVDSRRAVLGAPGGGAPALTLELPLPKH